MGFGLCRLKVEALAHVLQLPELREQEKIKQEVLEAQKKAAKEAQEKELFKARFQANRKETASRPVVASVSQTVPFSGKAPTGFKDVGVDVNKSSGG